VTLKGEKKRGERKEGVRIYREELRGGRFQRTVQLPLPVDADKVEAMLRDGVLRVKLPKREELKPRQISVKAN
jgi:HSP20 family protein